MSCPTATARKNRSFFIHSTKKKAVHTPKIQKSLFSVSYFLQNFHFGFEQFPIPTLNRLLYVTFCACGAAGDELLCLCFADACADGDSFLIDCADFKLGEKERREGVVGGFELLAVLDWLVRRFVDEKVSFLSNRDVDDNPLLFD